MTSGDGLSATAGHGPRNELLERLQVERYNNHWWTTRPENDAAAQAADDELAAARRRRQMAEDYDRFNADERGAR